MSKQPGRYMERRFVPLDVGSVEVREDSDGKMFVGHATVWDEETDFGFMREKVAKGAFAKTIKDGADVRFLFNHDPSSVMARTTAGSLRLSEDDTGLGVEADLDSTDVDVQRLLPKLRSGVVSQMSFGFTVVRDEMDDADSKSPLRTLREVELFDVSPVTFPAYEGTDAGLRDAVDALQRHVQALGLPLRFLGAQDERTVTQLLDDVVAIDDATVDPEQIRVAIDALSALLANDPAPLQTEHPEDDSAPLRMEHPGDDSLPPLDHFKRVLELNRNRLVA